MRLPWGRPYLMYNIKASFVIIGILSSVHVLLYILNAKFTLPTLKFDDNYLDISSSLSCNENDHSIFLLFAVPSRAGYFRERMAIRNSWGSIVKTDNSLRLIFFVGEEAKTINSKIKSMLAVEKQKYMDVIEIDIYEKYKNLAKKMIALLQWIYFHCNNPKFILKVDDDVFLNSNLLVNYLRNNNPMNSIIGCKVENASVDRNEISKHYISREEYKPKKFPDYIGGPAYIISGDILGKLYLATNEVPSIFLEDVYITGMCRKYINALALGHPGFSCADRMKEPCGEHFRNKISGHPYSSGEIERMWKHLKANVTCPIKKSL